MASLLAPPPAPIAAAAPATEWADDAAATGGSSGMKVFGVDEIARNILQHLDFASIDIVLQTLHDQPAWRECLRDSTLWQQLLQIHFKGAMPAELVHLALPSQARPWDWTNSELTCSELQQFLRSGDQREHFERTLVVLKADIAYIETVNGVPLDGLAFPTNSYLTNHYVGAAGAVFKRAGRGLVEFINDPLFRGRRETGSAVVTPAFDARVQKLIHCVGPRISQPNCFELLARTYESTMNAILREELQCVGVASISTGSMGVPADSGAQVGLRVMQTFIRSNHWEGNLGIICVEDHVYEAFTKQRQEILDAFNEEPPLPAPREY